MTPFRFLIFYGLPCIVVHLLGCAAAGYWQREERLQRAAQRAIEAHGLGSPQAAVALAALEAYKRDSI